MKHDVCCEIQAKGRAPSEQYFYQRYADALAYMKMYANGNLGIYLEIALIFIEESGKEIKVIALN